MALKQKQIIVDFIFTSLLFFCFILFMIEAKFYFFIKRRGDMQVFSSGVESYRVKTYESEVEKFAKSEKEELYNKTPNEKIYKISSIQDTLKAETEDELLQGQTEDMSDILNNPLFKGYYIQLGVFPNKEAAQQNIDNLKAFMSESFTTYIEKRNIQEKELYLAQVGVFSSKEDAIKFCEQLQKSSIGCVVVD